MESVLNVCGDNLVISVLSQFKHKGWQTFSPPRMMMSFTKETSQ